MTPPATPPADDSDIITPALLCQLFAELPFLSTLDEPSCEAIAPLLTRQTLAPGGILFYEADPSDAAFFLAEGGIEVFKSNYAGRKLPLLVLRDGGLLGEIGLLTGEPRTATARAISPVVVYRLSREAFEKACQDHSAAALDLTLCFARVLANRLSATDAKLFELFESDVSESLLKQLSETRAKLLLRMAH